MPEITPNPNRFGRTATTFDQDWTMGVHRGDLHLQNADRLSWDAAMNGSVCTVPHKAFDPADPLMAELAATNRDDLFAYHQDVLKRHRYGGSLETRFAAIMAVIRHHGWIGPESRLCRWHRLDGQWLPHDPKAGARA